MWVCMHTCLNMFVLGFMYDKRTLNLQGHTCKNECVVRRSKVKCSERKKLKKRAYGLVMNEDEDVWCFAYVALFYSVLRDLMTGCSTDSQHLYIPLSDRPSTC